MASPASSLPARLESSLTSPLADRWRLVLTPPLSGALNMAVDLGLMARARETGEAVLRIYTWAVPTLSFGRNQTAVGRYALDRIAALGADVVRRPTGGRAILHHREITYSVTALATEAVGLRSSYGRINAVLLDALLRLGVPAEVAAPKSRTPKPTDAPCFVAPTEGEMTTGGQKLVGSAQWREDGALLQHGSILVDDDQETLGTLMVTPPLDYTPVGTLRAALGRAPAPDEVAAAMFAAVRASEDARVELLDPGAVISAAGEFVGRFEDPQWTWRR